MSRAESHIRNIETKLQQELFQTIKNEVDVRNYLLSTSKLGNLIQEEIDLQVTDGRLNHACIRNQLNSFYEKLSSKSKSP